MRIIYEPGDSVYVEDNMDAGPTAACMVKLIKFKPKAKKWKVEVEVNTSGDPHSVQGSMHNVYEFYLQPNR